MRLARWGAAALVLFASGLLLSGSGCGKGDKTTTKTTTTTTTTGTTVAGKTTTTDGKVDIAKGKHEGWWCQEHGIPEDDCSLCQPDVAARLKKAGDWCKIHDRAQSQCFKCNPDFYKKFEAQYVAKYGKKPEPPPKAEFEK